MHSNQIDITESVQAFAARFAHRSISQCPRDTQAAVQSAIVAGDLQLVAVLEPDQKTVRVLMVAYDGDSQSLGTFNIDELEFFEIECPRLH